MAVDPARLYQQLLNTGLQNKDNPLYQLLKSLIDSALGVSKQTATIISGGGGGPNISDKEFLTAADESASLPNSRELLPGTNITFDDTTPNERTVNASGGGGALTRESDSFTTASIGSGGTTIGSFTITGGWQSAELLKLESDRACYIVLYATEAARNNDTRILPAIVDPLAGIGILMDAAFGVGGGEIDVSPPVVLYNIESPVDATFYYRLYNAEPSAGATEITLTYVGFE
jgi:hypothetical protein